MIPPDYTPNPSDWGDIVQKDPLLIRPYHPNQPHPPYYLTIINNKVVRLPRYNVIKILGGPPESFE